MPATEKTWRDQLRMHVVFGVSALIMLLGTVWMLAKDHRREWRQAALANREKEQWTTAALLQQQSAESESQRIALEAKLAAAKTSKIDPPLIDEFKAHVTTEDERIVDEGLKNEPADFSRLDQAAATHADASVGTSDATETREDLIQAMTAIAGEARRREDSLTTRRKFLAADQTAVTSMRGIAIGEGKPLSEIEKIEARISELTEEIAALDVSVAAAKRYRQDLEAIIKKASAPIDELEKSYDTIESDLDRLRAVLNEDVGPVVRTWRKVTEPINRLPVLDALYNGNIKLDQIWLPNITINYNFSSVPRYDRCINCHRAIDQTAPGTVSEPAYPAIPEDQRIRILALSTPETAPETASGHGQEPAGATLQSVYGFTLAPRGQIDKYAVTVQTVLPQSLAARAGLEMGDVIEEINGGKIYSPEEVAGYLLEHVAWGQPVELTIRRGLPQPYTSHPRLDLFVGEASPHPKAEMGCTICHDGQGSATDFKWASHTPNDPAQAVEWARRYEWFDNHHWIFPMTPQRFVESNCLKCHHEVVELKPSERFPNPPAPKLVAGYELVRDFGCYGCHEVNGYDGPDRRIGPDLRSEPNFTEVAAQILNDPGLIDDERSWAMSIVHSPDDNPAVRSQLLRSLKSDAASKDKRLAVETQMLADALKNVDAPGRLSKVGPSLRHLDSKVDFAWLYEWIRKPSNFRPTTRMPQFFGHLSHLESAKNEFPITDVNGETTLVSDQEYTARFENIEIRALSEFLLTNSQPFEYLDPPAGVTESASAERGKWLFESRGCLACHAHQEFPGINSTQGPDLSRVAAKFSTGKGQRWLYSWLRDPKRYHTKTVMPNVYLDPIVEVDSVGKPTGAVTDPAADIATYLLSVPTDWRPEEIPSQELTAEEERALEDLTAVWLSASFPKRLAATYAREGIPDRLTATVKVDERGLLQSNMTPANRTMQQLDYVARRSLSRYGCFGCHDIPGYETAKPIGTPLANWGRKETSQLAFENIGAFLASHGLEANVSPPTHGDDGHAADEAHHEEHSGVHGHGLDPTEFDPDTGFFVQSLNAHQRAGFLWQKLRQPRSFDYGTTRVKRYDERLRMPQFPFNAEDREKVMTFILGLTSEPPSSDKLIYNPAPREQAIVEGRHVLDKYNCAGCHVLDMERWQFAFEPDLFEEPPEVVDFPFINPKATPEEIAASLKPNRRGMLTADVHGMTVRSEETGKPNIVDIDGVPIEPDDTESEPYYEFMLYEPAVVAGAERLVGVQNLLIPAKLDGTYGPASGVAFPTNGGDLAKYLFSRVIAETHKTDPAAKGSEAWGWLPPPLHDEGRKVQTDWLHDFLMDPTPIRPAVVLRMPNFHMSSAEAAALVDYFAAKNNAEFPYEYNNRRRSDYLARLEEAHPGVFDDAMKIVTDGNYCVKCHSVGDYQAVGAIKTLGPQLGEVYRRLRPEFVRNWVGNPVRILPYTGMPVNIPFDPHSPTKGGVSQTLFPGTSIQQLDGLIDLLMNFDEYAKRQTTIRNLVKEPPAATTNPAGAALPGRGAHSALRPVFYFGAAIECPLTSAQEV